MLELGGDVCEIDAERSSAFSVNRRAAESSVFMFTECRLGQQPALIRGLHRAISKRY